MRVSAYTFAFSAAAFWLAAGTVQAQSALSLFNDDYFIGSRASEVSYTQMLALSDTESPELASEDTRSDFAGTYCGDSCCNNSCGCCDCCNCYAPMWAVRAGAVVLTRSGPNFIPPDGQTIRDASDFDWSGGPDIYLARRFSSCDWIEARYFSVQGWNAEYTLDDEIDLFDGFYDARLYSTEINLRRQYSNGFALLAGFRMLELHEFFNNDLIGDDFAFTTNTANYLYGGQIGADAVLWDRGGPFRVEGWAKAGIYSTYSKGHYTNSIGFDQIATDTQASFLGDLAVTGICQITEHIAFRAGYQLLWIEKIALAGEQLQYSVVAPPLPLDTNGGLFAHGALMSVDLTW